MLCFSFGNITNSENSLLDVMEEFFSVDENEDIDNDVQEDEESWYDNNKITGDIRSTICQFKDFAAANKIRKISNLLSSMSVPRRVETRLLVVFFFSVKMVGKYSNLRTLRGSLK